MKTRNLVIVAALLVMVLSGAIIAGDANPPPPAKTGETIDWSVMSSGGNVSTSVNYEISGTVCQTATILISSDNYQVSQGYWPAMSGGDNFSCCQIVGDINHDGAGPDISDLVYLVTFMFQNGPPPVCDVFGSFPEADINGDGVGPDISDLVHLVTYMFQNGAAPADCL